MSATIEIGNYLKNRWSAPSGYREVLAIAGPLILSTSSWSIQHVVDRMFLCWYSPSAMAAALPAGALNFTFIAFFVGTASYVNTFVAQYHGAKRPERIGPSIWQAIYFSLLGGATMLCLIPCADSIFRFAGHDAEVQSLESVYFRILCLGGIFPVYCSAVSGFFTGRGKTWTVMWVSFLSTGINIVLDYLLIFGHLGFPELGMKGAAIATVLSAFSRALVFSILIFSATHRREFNTFKGRRFERELFGRLMRFGIPSGIQFFLDMLAFSMFNLLVGRIGTSELAATTLAFQINTLAFMPMIGFGIAVSTLVGQRLGENKPDLAARSTWSTFHMTFCYMAAIAALFVLVPSVFIAPFAANADPERFVNIYPIAIVLLRFVALYCLFDGINIVFASALKGAGDTKFVMYFVVGTAWAVMVLPSWFVLDRGIGGLYTVWMFFTLWVCILAVGFLIRFLRGKWREMRVIEKAPEAVKATDVPLPESPTADVDL